MIRGHYHGLDASRLRGHNGPMLPALRPTADHALILPSDEDLRAAQGDSIAPATRRAYRGHLKRFFQWTALHDRSALPATPDTVARFLLHLSQQGCAVSTIGQAQAAIRILHQLNGLAAPSDDPGVKRAMKGLRNRQRERIPRQKHPLRPAEVLRAIWEVDAWEQDGRIPSVTARRDRALLATAYMTAARRSELAGLRLGDLGARSGGYGVTIRGSKTDRTGKGRPAGVVNSVNLPAADYLAAWLVRLDAADPYAGVFPAVDRHGNVSPDAMSGEAVAGVIRRWCQRAGIHGDIGGHSTRRGAATAASDLGVSLKDLKQLGGWESASTAMRYIADSDAVARHPLAGV